MAGNKKIGIDVEVNFQAQSAGLNQALREFDASLKTLREDKGNNSLFGNTEKAVNEVVKQFDKLSKMKLNTENVQDYIKQQDKLRDAIEGVARAAVKDNGVLISKQEKYNQTIEDARKKQEELTALMERAKGNKSGAVYVIEDNKRVKKTVDDLQKSYNGYTLVIANAEKGLVEVDAALKEQANVQEKANSATEQANGILVTNEQLLRKKAEAEAEAENQRTLDRLKQKITYYTSLAFSIQVVRRAIREAVQTYKELDESITSIAMVSGLSRDTLWGQIGTYNDLAKELGTTTGEVLNAAKLYYQQGRDTNSVLELTTESLKLAAIAGLETADATNYLTAAVNGFKIEAADAGQVTDVWAQLAAKNAVSVNELAVSISKVASIAQSAGMDIQSTSAFLTQMIATTREAPENLGTALKTIIARFQELKQSGAALEDGVDANKVEKALKTVGISLRDATGQFRDFDDVILELSSKWDSLDRNTQRYIATIAAGSRQQSRFIALVSDYEGLTKIMDEAADAQGAANEQFETYTEGLQASLNRLKASWEGFYTSLQEGHNLITGLINVASKLVNIFSKLGIVGGGLAAGVFVNLSKHLLSTAGLFLKSTKGAETFGKALLSTYPTFSKFIEGINVGVSVAAEEGVKGFSAFSMAIDGGIANLGALGSTLVTVLPWLFAIAGAVAAIVQAWRLYKEWEKKPETWREEGQNAKQISERYEEYADSIEEAAKAGGDWSDIRERLIAENYEFLKGIDLERISTQELIKLLREQARLEAQIAAEKRAAATQVEADRRAGSGANRKAQDNALSGGKANTISSNNQLPVTQVEKYTLALQEARDVAQYSEELFKIPIDDNDIEKLNALTYAIANYGLTYDKEGKVTGSKIELTEYLEFLGKLPEEQRAAFNALTSGTSWEDIGLYFGEEVTKGLVESFGSSNYSKILDTFVLEGEELAKQVRDGFSIAVSNTNNGLTNALLHGFENTDELSTQIKKYIISAYNAIDPNDSELQKAFMIYLDGIRNIDPSLITEELVDAFQNMDFESVYSQMLKADPDVVNPELLEYFRDIIGEVSASFIEGKQAVDEYNSALDTLNSLTDGASLDDYADSIWALSEDWKELGYETRQAMLEELWANTVIDESGQYMQAESELLQQLQQEYDLTSAEARKNAIDTILAEKAKVDAKIKEIDAVLDGNQVTIEAAEAELKALQEVAKGEASAEVAGHKAGAQAVVKHGNVVQQFINNILNKLLNKAKDTGIAAGSIELDSFEAIESEAIEKIMETDINDSLTNAQLAALRQRLQKYSDELAQQANTIDWYQSTADTKKGGGGGGGSSKETTDAAKEAVDALKELADAAKDAANAAKDAAKAELDAIKARLDARKDELKEEQKLLKDDLEKERHRNELRLQAWINVLNEKLDALKKELEDEQKALDDENDALNEQADVFIDAYNLEIDGIQAKIDALDKEAEAEDRLRKLQEARDAYERSRNQRTRLVLTQGAGWIFKTDTETVNQARDALKDAERDYEKAVLQDEIDALKETIGYWQEAKENIGKSADELERYNELLKEAQDIIANGGDAAALQDFISSVGANNQRVDRVQALQDQYDRESNADIEGSIAAQIDILEAIKDKLDWTLEDFADERQLEWQMNMRREQLAQGQSTLEITDRLNKAINDYVYGDMQTQLKKIESIDTQLEKIDDLIKGYEELGKNIGKSTEEIKAEQALIDKYGAITEKELGENSEYWNDLIVLVNESIDKQDKYLEAQKAYEDAQKKYEADKKAAQSVAAAQGAVNGNSTGSVIANNFNNGGGDFSSGDSSLTQNQQEPNDKEKGIIPEQGKLVYGGFMTAEAVQMQFASSAVYSATQEVIVPTTTSQGSQGKHLRDTVTNTNYEFHITTNANNVRDTINDAQRYLNF